MVWTNLQKLKSDNNHPGNAVSSGEDDSLPGAIPCSAVPYSDDALQQVEKLGQNYEQVIFLMSMLNQSKLLIELNLI